MRISALVIDAAKDNLVLAVHLLEGTGDLSELALGWCTYNGDHMSMYGVNASVPKTLIPAIIKAVAKKAAFRPAYNVLADI